MRWLPSAVIALAALAMLLHGPIPQLRDYHAFADARSWLGIPHAGDVLSNIPFAWVGLWALARRRSTLAWAAFDVALVLTAIGSSYYHLAPDDARLVWDRLPIALACAALLAAVHERTDAPRHTTLRLAALCAVAAASVAWWRATGDLRPYLLLQGAPLVLLPLWQWRARVPRRERILFALAIAAYVVAKILEVLDRAAFEAIGVVSGHTLKHLFAAAGAALLVIAREPGGAVSILHERAMRSRNG
jgi:hypothetical protein